MESGRCSGKPELDQISHQRVLMLGGERTAFVCTTWNKSTARFEAPLSESPLRYLSCKFFSPLCQDSVHGN